MTTPTVPKVDLDTEVDATSEVVCRFCDTAAVYAATRRCCAAVDLFCAPCLGNVRDMLDGGSITAERHNITASGHRCGLCRYPSFSFDGAYARVVPL